MIGLALLFDLLLMVMLLGLAWTMLTVRELFTAIVLYIMFGLTLSLVWVRLDAIDVALAEVALGTGLTGALFLSALGAMHSPPSTDVNSNEPHTTDEETPF